MREEFDRALKGLKVHKAPGPDNILGEILKSLGLKAKDTLFGIVTTLQNNLRVSRMFQRNPGVLSRAYVILTCVSETFLDFADRAHCVKACLLYTSSAIISNTIFFAITILPFPYGTWK